MYKIVNNNITITRGETATYNVKVIDKTTGAPFILPKNVSTGQTETERLNPDNFMAVFSVRRSDYIKDGYAMKKFLWFCGFDGSEDLENQHDCSNDVAMLNSTEILDYVYDLWANEYPPKVGEEKILHRRKLALGGYDYRYWDSEKTSVDGIHWIPYSFTIRFPFLYTDTANLSPKSYKYAMTIYGGNNLEIVDGELNKDTIDYKKPLVDAQFIVEADINE